MLRRRFATHKMAAGGLTETGLQAIFNDTIGAWPSPALPFFVRESLGAPRRRAGGGDWQRTACAPTPLRPSEPRLWTRLVRLLQPHRARASHRCATAADDAPPCAMTAAAACRSRRAQPMGAELGDAGADRAGASLASAQLPRGRRVSEPHCHLVCTNTGRCALPCPPDARGAAAKHRPRPCRARCIQRVFVTPSGRR